MTRSPVSSDTMTRVPDNGNRRIALLMPHAPSRFLPSHPGGRHGFARYFRLDLGGPTAWLKVEWRKRETLTDGRMGDASWSSTQTSL
jgi:hypothetical protein